MTPPAPIPPGDLSKPFRSLWTKTRKEIEDDGRWQASDAQLLTRYIRDLEMAHIALEGMRDDKGNVTLMVPGSKGQPAPHPNVKTYHDATMRADARARMLMLSPEARAKAGDTGPKKPGGGGFDLG